MANQPRRLRSKVLLRTEGVQRPADAIPSAQVPADTGTQMHLHRFDLTGRRRGLPEWLAVPRFIPALRGLALEAHKSGAGWKQEVAMYNKIADAIGSGQARSFAAVESLVEQLLVAPGHHQSSVRAGRQRAAQRIQALTARRRRSPAAAEQTGPR